MPSSRSRFTLPVQTIKDFKFLVQTVFTRLNCRTRPGLLGPYTQIVASAEETYPGKYNWTIEYSIVIDYEQSAQGIECRLTVSDLKNNWSQSYCKRQLDLIQETLQEFACKKTMPPDESTLYGRAKWVTGEELRHKGFIASQLHPQRLLLAPWGDEVIAVPEYLTQQHALVCGPTGVGKSSGFFIPNLIGRTDLSAIVTEAYPANRRPELYHKTAGWRAAKGHNIYFFSPGDTRSVRINPIENILRAPEYEHSTLAEELAQLVIINTTPPNSQRGDAIWDREEQALLKRFIAHAVAKALDPYTADPSLCNFGAIRQMAAWPEKKLMAEMLSSPSAFAAQEFEAFISHSSENFRNGVFSGLLSRTSIWTNENIASLMETNDIDPDELKHELFTFYFGAIARKPYLKPISSLVFNWLIDLATSTDFDYPLHLFLDEFTNFGYIPGIEELLSLVARKSGLALTMGFQDYNQLERVYQRLQSKEIVSQLATRIFFRPRNLETATEISKELGTQTIVERRLTDGGQILEKEVGQALLTPADLLNLADNEVIIFTGSTKPIQCTRFTHQTFPAPEGFPAPEREPIPVSPAFTRHKELHRQKLEAFRRQAEKRENSTEDQESVSLQEPVAVAVKVEEKRQTQEREIVLVCLEPSEESADEAEEQTESTFTTGKPAEEERIESTAATDDPHEEDQDEIESVAPKEYTFFVP